MGQTTVLARLLTDLLNGADKVLLEKLTGSKLINKFPLVSKTRSSLPYSQVPVTCPYPEH